MDYTKNYHLPQWVKSDRIMMEDFNQMCSDIDAGINAVHSENLTLSNRVDGVAAEAAKLPYVVGSYTGSGGSARRKITLGFRPSFLIVSGQIEGYNGDTGADRFCIFTSGTVFSSMFSMADDGFWVVYSPNYYPSLNDPNHTYDYIAFR